MRGALLDIRTRYHPVGDRLTGMNDWDVRTTRTFGGISRISGGVLFDSLLVMLECNIKYN